MDWLKSKRSMWHVGAVCGQNRLFQDFARNQEVDGLRGEYGRKAET